MLFFFLLPAHWKYSEFRKLMCHPFKWMNRIYLKDSTEEKLKCLLVGDIFIVGYFKIEKRQISALQGIST